MIYSIEVIEQELSKLQKINYNPYFWWRRWVSKNKPLHKYTPLWDKILNGDYELSPYRWQIHLCNWEIEQKTQQFGYDRIRWTEETATDRERRRRLIKDDEQYEFEILTQLQKDFLTTFKMTQKDYEIELESFDGTLKEFYIYCEKKYTTYYKATVDFEVLKPRRGRPPKNKS